MRDILARKPYFSTRFRASQQDKNNLLLSGAEVDYKDENGFTALMIAVESGHEQDALELINRGVTVDETEEDGWTALMFAAQNGHEQIARALIEAGANVNHLAKSGHTALMQASKNGHEQVARLLLEAGATVDAAANNGFTSLMLAAQKNHEQVALALIGMNANVNAAANNGFTSLMLAAQNNHEQVARALIEAGATVDAVEESGMTALKLAAQEGHIGVARLLLRDEGQREDTMLVSDDGTTFRVVQSWRGELAQIYADILGQIEDQPIDHETLREMRDVNIFYTTLAVYAFTSFIKDSKATKKENLLRKIKEKVDSYPVTTAPKTVVRELKEIVFGTSRVPTITENDIKERAFELYTQIISKTNKDAVILKDDYKNAFEITFSPLTDPAQTPEAVNRTSTLTGNLNPRILF